jgi:hypothetical protein
MKLLVAPEELAWYLEQGWTFDGEDCVTDNGCFRLVKEIAHE